jgi:hypothetical protein
MLRISIHLFLIFTCLSTFAQVSPSLKIEANEILIGDQVKTTVSVESAQSKNVSFPELVDYWKSDNVEILNLSNIEKINSNDGKLILKQSLTLVFWDTGNYVLPALPFAYTNQENNDTVFSEKLMVKVRYPDEILGDSTYMAPIKPILEERKNFFDYLLAYRYLCYAIIGFLIFCVLIYLISKRIVNKNKANVPFSPESKALHALNKLLEADYSKKGQHALYHEGISFIIRTYLNEKFGIKTLESITAEILESMKELELSDQFKSELKELLETADLVKYAKASPLPAADKFAADYIRRLVNTMLENQRPDTEKN